MQKEVTQANYKFLVITCKKNSRSEEEVIWLAYGTTVWCSLLYTIDTGKSLCAHSGIIAIFPYLE